MLYGFPHFIVARINYVKLGTQIHEISIKNLFGNLENGFKKLECLTYRDGFLVKVGAFEMSIHQFRSTTLGLLASTYHAVREIGVKLDLRSSSLEAEG